MTAGPRVNRRDFLRLAGLVASGATLAACSPVYSRLGEIAARPLTGAAITSREFTVLKRLTYGPAPYEHRRVAESGLEGWIEDQLAPAGIDDQSLVFRLRPFDFLDQDADVLSTWEKEELVSAFKQATLLRKIFSRRQVYELMAEFWTDFFNIALAKGDCWFLKVVDDREVIRANALGNFHELLWASAHSPAMLVYLDNQANHREAPNENYARELLELHTLGVDGGYGQPDVMALARCLTGWTVKDHFWRGQFTFEPDSHDTGRKIVLGQSLEPAGMAEAESVLTQLAQHPSTAIHVATRLARRFLSDDPLASHRVLVERAAQTFLKTHGDIRAVLRVILLDSLLDENQTLGPKYRRPLDFLAAGLRSVDAKTDAGPPLQTYLARMGGALFDWPTPDGPPDYQQAWMTNLVPRWQFALALAMNELPGSQVDIHSLFPGIEAASPEGVVDTLCLSMLGSTMDTSARRQVIEALVQAGATDSAEIPAVVLAGLLASPAFQWR